MAAHKRQRTALATQRADLNRRSKAARAKEAALRDGLPPGLPSEPVSASDLLARMELVRTHNDNLRYLAQERHRLTDQHELDLRVAQGMRAKIAELSKELAALEAKKDADEDAMRTWEPLPPPISDDDLRQQIAQAEQTNALIRRATEAADADKEAGDLEAQSCDITADILALDHQVEERIRDAHLPLPGLAFDTEGDAVLYQGVPLSQASGAEQLRVGVSLAIAANPKLKVMLIRDGSLLDDNNLALLREMAEQSGHQIWIERVGNDGASVVLEDGEIVGGNLAVNLCPADTDVEDLN